MEMNKINIIIDTRETQLYSEIIERDLDKYKNIILINKESLDLGDIHIKYEELLFIFERKTINDLVSSIKDGRYKEQKARLLSNVNNINQITYIIEGDNIISSVSYNRNKSILLGAYLHTLFRDNIRVLFTNNVPDTVTLILTIATKIIDNPEKFLSNIINTDYTDCVRLKQKKIDNIDPSTCYIMQLSQIPHISNILAKNIATHFPTMKFLLDSLVTCNTDAERVELLCSVEKIGKEKAKNIIKYLLQ
jgi:crossover junction endonuclease MUS81